MNTFTAELRAPDTLRLCLLGEPLLLHPRGELPLAAERRFQLLAYLAHQADWVARERLAALFWPDHGAEQARSNLRKVLFRLKSLADLPPLEEHNGALRWPVATDIQAFEQALAAGDTASALAHWRGEPWQGLGAEDVPGLGPWLEAERQRLRARWRQLLLTLCRSEPQPEPAAAWARRLLAHDALDEEALVLLVQQELRAGRRPAARQAYETFRQALQDSLGLEPAAATRALLEAAPTATTSAPVAAPAGATTVAAVSDARFTPADPTHLIGREAECLEIQTRLQQIGQRWLTLVGPGGVGKTALAQRALQRLAPQFTDAGVAVALEDLGDEASAVARIAERVAAALGQPLTAHQAPAAQLAPLLRGRQLLLLLDNLEQLRSAAHTVHTLLVACPGVQVLATSRERLGLPAEQTLALQGLPWPAADDLDRVDQFDAVRLFHRQALAQHPGFRLADHAPAVAALCELVEGHPLALQLAAVWTRHFPVGEIVRELAAGTLAAAPAADAGSDPGARHRSIDAAIDHSWQRLVEAERVLLQRLSVCRGGFTLDAARAVAGASLPALSTLIDKSLVRHDEGSADVPARFSLHPLVLQFVIARHGAEARRAALEAHSQHFMGLLARFPRGRWAEQPAYFAQLDPEVENLRQAWHQAVADGRATALAQATIGLASYCHARVRCEEGAGLLEAAEPVLQPDALALAQLKCSAALLASTRSDYARTAELARQALRLLRRRRDARLTRAALFLLGNALLSQGHYDASFRCYEDALARARSEGDGHGTAMNLNALAEVATQAGRLDEAMDLARQSLEAQAALGLLNADTLTDLAHAQRLAGHAPAARQSFERARAALPAQARGTEPSYLAYHHALARLAWGEPARAEALAQEAGEGLALGGQPVLAIGISLLRARLAQARGRFTEAHAHVRAAAADAGARRLLPWQLAAVLAQAELWLAERPPGPSPATGHPLAADWLALVQRHSATPHEERQRAATALAGLATAGPATPPALEDALRVLLAP